VIAHPVLQTESYLEGKYDGLWLPGGLPLILRFSQFVGFDTGFFLLNQRIG
jgi:hypothetical protein